MKLKKAVIENYRQYLDTEIEFSTDKDKNFTVILGNNGTGKTTLLNACNWCLYGEEIHNYEGQDSSLEICNNKYKYTLDDNDSVLVSVKLEFDDDGDYLAFQRKTKFFKRDGNLVEDKFSRDFFVIKKKDGDYIYDREDFFTISKKIPKDVEEYFFFDGARLGDYFQKTSTSTIKKAVFNLTQLNLFSKVHEDLGKVKDKYIKQLKKESPKLGITHESITDLEKSIEKDMVDLEENKKILIECKEQIDDLDDKLINIKASDVEKFVKNEKKLDLELARINNKLKVLQKERNDLILKSYPYILSYNHFKDFKKMGNELREKKHIPSNYRKQFLEDLLADNTCICGTKLDESEECRKNIEYLLKNINPITDKSEEINVALAKVDDIINKIIFPFKDKIMKLTDEIWDFEEDKNEKVAEKQKIVSFLESNPIEEVQYLRKLKSEYKNQSDKINRNIGSLENDIKSKSEKLGDLRKRLGSEGALAEACDLYSRKIDFCERAIEAANEINNELTEDMRQKIENYTKEQFIKIQWKEDEFVDIRLDENYDIFIKNKWGDEEKPGNLSDGEKLCLGLCFMSALHNTAGFDLPIMMDTPLGNLGTDIKRNIAKFLPEFVGDKQIILLVTDSEYTEEFRSIIYKHVGKEYLIDWKNTGDGKESRVVLNG